MRAEGNELNILTVQLGVTGQAVTSVFSLPRRNEHAPPVTVPEGRAERTLHQHERQTHSQDKRKTNAFG